MEFFYLVLFNRKFPEFAWLTANQANGRADTAEELAEMLAETVQIFEDRCGEMIPCLVTLDNLVVLEEY